MGIVTASCTLLLLTAAGLCLYSTVRDSYWFFLAALAFLACAGGMIYILLVNITACRVWAAIREVCQEHALGWDFREEFDQFGEPAPPKESEMFVVARAMSFSKERLREWVRPRCTELLQKPHGGSVLLFANSPEWIQLLVYYP